MTATTLGWFGGFFMGFAVCGLFLINILRSKSMEIQEKNVFIWHLNRIINGLMPGNACRASLESGVYCRKPAKYIYQTVPMCEECAQSWIKNGANPPPKRYDFELEAFMQ